MEKKQTNKTAHAWHRWSFQASNKNNGNTISDLLYEKLLVCNFIVHFIIAWGTKSSSQNTCHVQYECRLRLVHSSVNLRRHTDPTDIVVIASVASHSKIFDFHKNPIKILSWKQTKTPEWILKLKSLLTVCRHDNTFCHYNEPLNVIFVPRFLQSYHAVCTCVLFLNFCTGSLGCILWRKKKIATLARKFDFRWHIVRLEWLLIHAIHPCFHYFDIIHNEMFGFFFFCYYWNLHFEICEMFSFPLTIPKTWDPKWIITYEQFLCSGVCNVNQYPNITQSIHSSFFPTFITAFCSHCWCYLWLSFMCSILKVSNLLCE